MDCRSDLVWRHVFLVLLNMKPVSNFITGRNRQAKSVPGLSAEDWPVETRKAGIDSAAN
jgi:hypothetical protein